MVGKNEDGAFMAYSIYFMRGFYIGSLLLGGPFTPRKKICRLWRVLRGWSTVYGH
jgi:hypothetical protein